MKIKSAVSRRKRVKKILKEAKGYWGGRSKVYRRAKETVYRAWVYGTRDRKTRKHQFRRLWITRINAAVRAQGLKYSEFIACLKKKNIVIDRSILQELAVKRPEAFGALVDYVRK